MKTKTRVLAGMLCLSLLGSPWQIAGAANPAGDQGATDVTPDDSGRSPGGFAPDLIPSLAQTTTASYAPVQDDANRTRIPEIDMFVGESRVFPTPGVARIAVGNGKVLTAAALDKKAVIIFANNVGVSSLFVWNADGRYERVKINVVPGDTTRIAREIAAFLKSIPGAEASVIGDKVIIQGDRLSDRDLQKIKIITDRYKDNVINFTDPMGWEKMVLMDVKIVEFPRTLLKNTGIQWTSMGGGAIAGIWGPIQRLTNGPYQINIQTGSNNPVPITNPSGTGGITVPSGLNVLSLINLGLNAQLNLLQQSGDASILAEPQLSAKNGSKASFFAGGEIPYSVSNLTGTTVQFKDYGIKLDIEPRVNHEDDVDTVIKVEDSSIDSSLTTTSGPALLTRKMQTEFNVRNGQTIVLSGLLSRNVSDSIQKVPLLGDIPVLGALFRSRNFLDKQTELVVFVTPTVVTPQASGLVDRIHQTKIRLEQQLGAEPYLSDPLQPGRDEARPNAPVSSPVPASSAPVAGTVASAAIVRPLPQAVPATPVSSYAAIPSFQNPLAMAQSKSVAPSGAALQVVPRGVALFARPGGNSQIMTQLPGGSIVRLGLLLPPDGMEDWCDVVLGSVHGWVECSRVRPTAIRPATTISSSPRTRVDQRGTPLPSPVVAAEIQPVTAASQPTRHSMRPYRTLLNHLALRVSPDINAAVVRYLPQGTQVEPMAQLPVGPWMAVRAADSTGWVASQWLLPEH